MSGERLSEAVPASLDGERADKAVAVLFSLSRSIARRLIEEGAVLVDGSTVAPSRSVSTGACVEAVVPEAGEGLDPAPLEFGIAHVDDHVLVVDKPAGLVVHPGSGTTGPTLAAGLLHRFPELAEMEDRRWGLVHRLDRDTSGLLLVGRTTASFDRLQAALRRREIERRYLCLVTGTLESATGTIDAPVGRDPRNPVRMAVVRDGRPARTHYRRIAEWSGATLLDVRLETGRTHQIRVHMASIGHNVVGDQAYGARKPVAADLDRQWLHAAKLAFDHPVGGDRVTVRSDPPADLRESLASLGAPTGGRLPPSLATPF
jgi:23S rRNA pseudouridine1911/1915/1917 synthase